MGEAHPLVIGVGMNRYVLVVYGEDPAASVLLRMVSEVPLAAFQVGDTLELAGVGVRVITGVRHRLEHQATPGGMFASLHHEIHLLTRPA